MKRILVIIFLSAVYPNCYSLTDTIYKYSNYTIKVKSHHEEMGEAVIITNKKNKKTFTIDEGDSYFVAVVDSFLILDSGTSTFRGLSVYNIDNNKKVFTATYFDNLKIDGKIIYFKEQIRINDKNKIPKCPKSKNIEYNGYLEECLFDLSNLKSTRTGKYECAYFE